MAYFCINDKCPQRKNPDETENPDDIENPGDRKCAACNTRLLINERYWLRQPLKSLNRSASVEVFEVSDDLGDGHRKVMKILRNIKREQAFEDESTALIWLSQLNHPGIPSVKGDGKFMRLPCPRVGNLHCLVMEKIEGQTLEQWLSQPDNKLSTELALDWLDQLIEILDIVHQCQLLHGDIKPSNIMLLPNETLALIDFGSVQRLPTNEVMTTPYRVPDTTTEYTPLEQVRGQPVIPQSDFFALGRTFVHLLTSQSPQEIKATSETNLFSWRQHTSQLNLGLADFIDWLIAPVLDDRPSNTAVVIRKIANLRQSLQTAGTRPQKLYWWGLLTGAVTTMAVGLALWVGWQWRPHYQTACETPITEVSSLDFSPNGKWLAVTSPDQTVRLVRPIKSENPENWNCQRLNDAVFKSQFSPNSKYLTTAAQTGLYVTPVSDNGTLEQSQYLASEDPVVSLSFSPNGHYLATGTARGIVNFWHFKYNQWRWIYRLPTQNTYITDLSFSSKGHHIVVVTLEGQVSVWDLELQKRKFNRRLSKQGTAATFSPTDEHHLVIAGKGQTTELWDINHETPSSTKLTTDTESQQVAVWDLRFSPDGRHIVTVTSDRKAKVWSLDSQNNTFKSYSNVVAIALSVAQDSSPPQLATAHIDGAVQGWLMTGGHVSPLASANGSVIAKIAFNPTDANTLAVAYADGTTKLITAQD